MSKSEKSDKKRHAEVDPVVSDNEETEEARLARKAAKKEAKRARKAAESAAAAAEDESNETVEVPAPSKSEKKDKKEKKSKSEPEEEEAATAPASSKADKKDKKDKKEKKSSSSSSSAIPSAPASSYLKKQITQAEADAFRVEHNIKVVGTNGSSTLPFTAFEHLSLPADVSRCWGNFTAPTAIQAQAWPALLQGQDVIGISETGSGKTFGFMLPAIMHLRALPARSRKAAPSILILAPTRELAMQTQTVIDDCRKHCSFTSVCVYGGVDKRAQLTELRAGSDVVVATPGRLLAMLNEQTIDLSHVSYFVLDEADRLLDMGFEPDVRAIAAATRPKESRQTLLFSATWPEAVQKLGRELIRDEHIHIVIGREPQMIETEDGTMVPQTDRLLANKRITQTVEVFEDWYAKKPRLRELLKQIAGNGNVKIIVFVLYKKEVPELEREISNQGYRVVGISSDYAQDQRTAALADFKSGKASILVATDVAARGLDIPNVEHVVNYSFPLTIEDYVHRIGRTGRAGKTGNAWTFFVGRDNKPLAGALQAVLREANQHVPESLLKFGTAVKKKEHSMYGSHFRPSAGSAPMPEKKHFKF